MAYIRKYNDLTEKEKETFIKKGIRLYPPCHRKKSEYWTPEQWDFLCDHCRFADGFLECTLAAYIDGE